MDQYIAKTFQGLEPTLAAELENLGAMNIVIIKRGVSFEGGLPVLYRANYQCRTALRILKTLFSFEALDDKSLYGRAKKYDWTKLFGLTDTFSIDATVRSTLFTHSRYAVQVLKDAIVDQFREATGERPNVDTDNPKIRLNLYINEKDISISLDSSSEPLFKRGYRSGTGDAPINEVLAGGLIALSGWNGETDLLDPMCGSGTLLIEAAMKVTNTPAQFFRKDFGFMQWPDFNDNLWEQIKLSADSKILPLNCKISGSDLDQRVLQVCAYNLKKAGFGEEINIRHDSFFKMESPEVPITVMMNPPYDERIPLESVETFYKNIGDKLKQDFSGCKIWIITGNLDGLKKVGLRTSRRFPLLNGQLDSRFVLYDMYVGTKRIFNVKEDVVEVEEIQEVVDESKEEQ